MRGIALAVLVKPGVDGLQMPTWNYVASHAHGMLEALDDERRLCAISKQRART